MKKIRRGAPRSKAILQTLCIMTFAFSLIGCGNPAKPDTTTTPTHSETQAHKGIITMAPNLTETVFALGQGSQVMAVGTFDDYPPEIATLPKVGGYVDPDCEKIALLNPTLIIAPGKYAAVTRFATMKGLRVLNVTMDSLTTIDSGIREIGHALGAETQADTLCTKIRQDLDAVRQAVAQSPHPKVLILTMRQEHNLNTLYTANRHSFISEIVNIAGGENIYADASTTYFEASKETLVVKAPDVIIEFHAGEKLSATEQKQYKTDWQQLPSLPAVQQKRIYIITESHAVRPGPRIGNIARMLARLLHPDVSIAD